MTAARMPNESAAEYVARVIREQDEERGRAAISDPSAFWSALTPAQALALLRAAPKVAGPWERTENGDYRRGPYGHRAASVFSDKWSTSEAGGEDTGSTKNARAAADAALRAAGWLLCDEEPEKR